MENSPYAVFKDDEGNYVQDPLMFQYDRNNLTNWYYEKQFLELQKGYTTFNTIFNAKLKLPFGITYTFNAAPRLHISMTVTSCLLNGRILNQLTVE